MWINDLHCSLFLCCSNNWMHAYTNTPKLPHSNLTTYCMRPLNRCLLLLNNCPLQLSLLLCRLPRAFTCSTITTRTVARRDISCFLLYKSTITAEILHVAALQDDTYFALVEYKYKPKHTPDAFTNVGYKIMELDTMYDDTCLKVTSLSERSSFSPEDLAVMGQSDAGIKAMSSTTPFPEHEVTDYPTGLENEVVVNNLKTWCKARSSGESEVILDSALDHSFKLWDAYGMLPMLCDPARRAEPDACVVGFTDLKDMIKQTKHRYLVTCKMIDNGVSLDKNVAFTHWCSSITNKQSKQHFNIEGLEVDIFGSDGKLKNIWQFRDPMDFELDMLEGRMPAGDSYKAHAA
eukprot:GHRR01001669.1.p1 GENE.GHRR01001669.1~~GHRR01001669.1.p1  ORF type:complete len:348 (+),score=79.80 GHRR01001669.1:3367-4410(+)